MTKVMQDEAPESSLEPAVVPLDGNRQSYDKGIVGAVAGVALIVAIMVFRLVGTPFPWEHSADALSKDAREARTEAFLASAPLELRPMPLQDQASALASMKLDEQSRLALGARVLPVSTSADSAPLRLAWLTVWDTDDEDGDVIRIDSEGYSRTVSLTKKPMILAVPVPSGGIINITGVRDGEGGGITVGAASQSSQVVLPIMSVGQVVGLHVKVR